MKTRTSRSKVLVLLVALCGGSLLSSCTARIDTALIDGSKNFLFELLNQTATDLIGGLAEAAEG